jgi:hypothetical protein
VAGIAVLRARFANFIFDLTHERVPAKDAPSTNEFIDSHNKDGTMESSSLQALTVAEHDALRRCPHCNHKLTYTQVITLMHGSGFEDFVPVRFSDGVIDLMEVGLVNPKAAEVLEGIMHGDPLPPLCPGRDPTPAASPQPES